MKQKTNLLLDEDGLGGREAGEACGDHVCERVDERVRECNDLLQYQLLPHIPSPPHPHPLLSMHSRRERSGKRVGGCGRAAAGDFSFFVLVALEEGAAGGGVE